jgi:hypothetical protein
LIIFQIVILEKILIYIYIYFLFILYDLVKFKNKTLKNIFKNVIEPNCYICEESQKEGKLVKINFINKDYFKYLCEFWYNECIEKYAKIYFLIIVYKM